MTMLMLDISREYLALQLALNLQNSGFKVKKNRLPVVIVGTNTLQICFIITFSAVELTKCHVAQ